MRNTDPADIPDAGERLDQTLLEIGKTTSWNERTESLEDAIVIKTIVDSGSRAKKKLSCPFFISGSDEAGYRFRDNDLSKFKRFLDVIGVDPWNAVSKEQFIASFDNALRSARFSAMVRPVEFETEKGRYVRYEQTFFSEPENEREIKLHSEPTQFQR